MSTKVTVVVVNWNGGKFIEKCLAALMAQTVMPQEIILLDNGSTDGSLELANRFPAVKVIALNHNEGFARGNNLAIASASKSSDWIALMNPDAFAEPRWLEELLDCARRNPTFDVFGSKLLNAANPQLLDGACDVYHVSGRVWREGHGKPVAQSGENEREMISPCAAAAMYRHSALVEVGGFDEDFFCYVEDVDLGFRLRLAGYRCLYVPQSVVHHVGSGTTGGQHSDFSVYHGHRNLVWTFIKDMPGLLFWLLLPLHIMLNLASLIWFTFKGRGRIVLCAKRDALWGLPKMWRKRIQVQEARVASTSEIWRLLNKSLFRV